MKTSLIGLSIGALLATASWAGPVLDFSTPAGATGSISYAGGATPLIGSNIESDTITGLSTPANSGAANKLICTTCVVDFTTGNSTGGWNWAGNPAPGSIKVLGSADGLPAGSTLLTGSITSATILSVSGTEAVITGFVDTVNATIASYFGLAGGPSATWQGSFQIFVGIPGGTATGAGFTADTIGSGDLQTTPVPEPASVMLLGGLLLAGATTLRKKLHRA